ncbi:MAG: hypothetical protein V1859_09055 [archaeon]
MARPINPTPILCGADAEKFIKETDSVRYSSEKEKLLKECDRIYKEIKQKK